MTRLQQFQAEVNRITLDMIKSKGGEPKMLQAEMNWNMDTLGYTWDMTSHLIPSGLQKQFIINLGMEVCKKYEADYLLTIGEKTECGCWIIGKYKNYWLRVKDVLKFGNIEISKQLYASFTENDHKIRNLNKLSK